MASVRHDTDRNADLDLPLPEGWASAKVSAIADSLAYGYTASAKAGSDGPRFLRITDLQNGRVDWNSVPTCQIGHADVEKYSLHSGDIVFTRTGATTGKSFLIRSCPAAVFASYLIRLRLLSDINPALLAYFFQTPDYWSFVSDNVSGIAQPSCNATKLSELKVPIPPSAEQQRLVEAIAASLSKVDAARNHLSRVPLILKRFRQAVLAAACSGKLTSVGIVPDGELPLNWHRCRIDSLFSVRTGGTPLRTVKEYFVSGSIPWVKTGELKNQDITCVGDYITERAVEESNAKLFPTGTILIAMYGEGKTRGQIGRLTFPAATNQACAALINTSLPPETEEYVFTYLLSQYETLRAEAVGGNQPNLNLSIIKEWEIPMPPPEQQREIVKRVKTLLSIADAVQHRMLESSRRSDKLTQSILAKAFRGDLVPTEAELARREGRDYEHASVLLERIRKERESTESVKPPSSKRRTSSRAKKAEVSV
jgi:type I restriction enzyme, S subunit